jgi:hypothetical protein
MIVIESGFTLIIQFIHEFYITKRIFFHYQIGKSSVSAKICTTSGIKTFGVLQVQLKIIIK